MPDKFNPEVLHSLLGWRHVGPIPDPPAPWILSQLDKAALVQLAGVQLELEKTRLEAGVKAVAAAQQIIAKARG